MFTTSEHSAAAKLKKAQFMSAVMMIKLRIEKPYCLATIKVKKMGQVV